MRSALLILTVTILVAVLWAAGEQHRQNCIILDGRQSCSILPWDDGKRGESSWGDYGPGWGEGGGW